MDKKIKVLIVDDSALMRNIISHIVESSPRLEVCGKAINGQFALDKLKMLSPDIIVTDIEMPQMNGIEFLKKRRELGIEIPVIVLSSLVANGAAITMEALSLGACDFVQKPSTGSSEMERIKEQLIFLLEKYGEAYRFSARLTSRSTKGFSLSSGSPPEGLKKGKGRLPRTPIGLVAISISTGGPYALRRVLSRIPASFPVPIMIVQHMPVGFTDEFAKGLNRICPLEVKEAAEGDIIRPGRVFIAQGGKHMVLKKQSLAYVVSITDGPPQNSHKPSAGKLFESAAKCFGSRALGVIMTGMGHDGSVEIGDIYKLGGVTIGQNESTSVVYGMPKVAEQNGFLDYILDLEDISPKIIELVKMSLGQ